jgi:hypothetical protein
LTADPLAAAQPLWPGAFSAEAAVEEPASAADGLAASLTAELAGPEAPLPALPRPGEPVDALSSPAADAPADTGGRNPQPAALDAGLADMLAVADLEGPLGR